MLQWLQMLLPQLLLPASVAVARRAKLSIRFKSKGTLNFVIAFALKFYLSFSWRKLGLAFSQRVLCCFKKKKKIVLPVPAAAAAGAGQSE